MSRNSGKQTDSSKDLLGQEDPHISSLNVATRQNSSSSPGYCSEETFAFLVNNIGAYFSVELDWDERLFPQKNFSRNWTSRKAFLIFFSAGLASLTSHAMYFSTPIILITLLSSPVGAFFGHVVKPSSGATSYGIYSTKSVTPSSPMMAPNDSDESDVIYSGEVLTEMGGEDLAPYKM